MSCELAGATTVAVIWVAALVAGNMITGEAAGFVIIIVGLVGIWAGHVVRAQCRARRQ